MLKSVRLVFNTKSSHHVKMGAETLKNICRALMSGVSV